jgi:hypothetical protein
MFEAIRVSDESRVILGHDNRWVWYRKREDSLSAAGITKKFPPALVVFAVIGVGYKSTSLIVDGSINAERYVQNCFELGFIGDLDRIHGPWGWIFQQEGAPCHMSHTILDCLEQRFHVLRAWPRDSPDLSPIEMFWAILKRGVTLRNSQTLNDLTTGQHRPSLPFFPRATWNVSR